MINLNVPSPNQTSPQQGGFGPFLGNYAQNKIDHSAIMQAYQAMMEPQDQQNSAEIPNGGQSRIEQSGGDPLTYLMQAGARAKAASQPVPLPQPIFGPNFNQNVNNGHSRGFR